MVKLVGFDGRKNDIAIAFSGGGFRAVAFHLGCLRAIHRYGLLNEVKVISGVSGGAIIAAMYAYSEDEFEKFEKRVVELLNSGLQNDIFRETFFSIRLFGAIGTMLSSGVLAKLSQSLRALATVTFSLFLGNEKPKNKTWIYNFSSPLPRWISRTTAFESVLRSKLFGCTKVSDPTRPGLSVVLNATELSTGTAFRFGSESSGGWRFGNIKDNDVDVASAVAASAAYPILLPALHRRYVFVSSDGSIKHKRVVLTDGGVYDNLGVTCLEPERDSDFTAHVYNCGKIICCVAGHGQTEYPIFPYGWVSRVSTVLKLVMRKAQDGTVSRMFNYLDSGKISKLILPYLGQNDRSILELSGEISIPDNFVKKSEVAGYPTNFKAMSESEIRKLRLRGEQLTTILLKKYWDS